MSRSSDLGGGWEPPEAAELDRLLSDYDVHEFITVGGMAAVYRGVQKSMDRDVAVKVIPAGASGEYAYAARFQREAKAMAHLTHPNIVTIYDFGQAGDFLFLIMEFVEGSDLHKMGKAGELDPKKATGYLGKICDALEYAHGLDIVHRDIKPANIMVRPDGTVKVTDFGLAKILNTGLTQMTVAGCAMGTPDYVAPESLEPGGDVDQRADVYSLGVLTYELFTGTVPRGVFEQPSTLNPDIDRRVDAVVERAMKRSREERFPSVAEFRAALKSALSGPKLITGNTGRVLPVTGRIKPLTGRVKPLTGTVSTLTSRIAPTSANTGRVLPMEATGAQPVAAIPVREASSGGAWKMPLAALGGAAVVIIGAVIAFSLSGNKENGKPDPDTSGNTPDPYEAGEIWAPPKDDPSKPTGVETGGENPSVPVSGDPKPTRGAPDLFAEITFPLPEPRRPNIGGTLVSFPFITDPVTAPALLEAIPELDDVVQLAVAGTDADKENWESFPSTGLALRADGSVVAWGRNNANQTTIPTDLGDVVQVATGKGTCFALRSDGTVRAWGANTKSEQDIPESIQGKTVQITAGNNHAAALLRDGTVVTWGAGEPTPDDVAKVIRIGAGEERTLALTAEGKVHLWESKSRPYDFSGINEAVIRFGNSLDRPRLLTESGRLLRTFHQGISTRIDEVKSGDAPFERVLFTSLWNDQIGDFHTFALSESGDIVHNKHTTNQSLTRESSVHPAFKSEAANCIQFAPWRTHAIAIRITDTDLRKKAISERDDIRHHRTGPLLADNPDPKDPETPNTPGTDPNTGTESPGTGTSTAGIDPAVGGGQLAKIYKAYQEEVALNVDKPHAESLTNLQKLYEGGLKRAEDAAAAAGNLDAIVAIRNEAKLLAEGGSVPASDPEGTPPVLKNLRGTFRRESAKIAAARTAAAAPVRQKFIGALISLESQLTKAKDITGAIAVRTFRTSLKDPAAAPAIPTPPKPPVTPPTGAGPVIAKGSKPGHLRAFGSLFKGTNLESGVIPLKTEEYKDIADFVQVVASERNWAALRADGTVVGLRRNNEGEPMKLGASDIVTLLAPDDGDLIFGINKDGVLGKISNNGFTPENWLVGKGKVTGWGRGFSHNIALTEDGNAHVIGTRYSHPTEPFPTPPKEALENIAFVATARNSAASITKNGEIIIWGKKGVARNPVTSFKGNLIEFQSRLNGFTALTDEGNLYWIKDGEGGSFDFEELKFPGKVAHISALCPVPPIVFANDRWRFDEDKVRSPEGTEFYKSVVKDIPSDVTAFSHWYGGTGHFAVWIEPVRL